MRKLTETDRGSVLDYLKQDPEINLFIISDIENYGLDSPDIQEIWAEFEPDTGDYIAVLLRYYSSYVFYTHNNNYDFVNSPMIPLLKKAFIMGKAGELSAKGFLLDRLDDVLNTNGKFEKKHRYFMKCEEINPTFPISHIDNVQWADEGNIEMICELIDSKIGEFGRVRNRGGLKKGIREGKEKLVLIKDKDTKKAIATAQITAENSTSAMIIGVATDPQYRKQGYASACIYAVTKYLIDKGKSACLFYDNPKAGSIYKKLGYVEIDDWCQLSNI